jgi:GR25 family glycosyltransferase involved in LPS biosynthesis
MKEQLASVGLNETVDVVEAVPIDCGALGCALSHILAVQLCIASHAKTCLIFEDDFLFTISPLMASKLISRLFAEVMDWRIVLLSGNVKKAGPSGYNFLNITTDVQTASGYLIRSHYAPIVLHNFLWAAAHMRTAQSSCDGTRYAIDQHWKALQKNHTHEPWYLFHPKVGRQRKGYSSIEKKNVDYQKEEDSIPKAMLNS